ncbi:MAG: ABC transporter ATP-binding protein [Lachnospiraceae bacterium]|nr:ABC transporter ATP-binding protein [Lachnospiraceae bacterium]
MIEISHLVKKYGDHYAVKDLTVTIQKGQIYGFLGPNGAGKSTTMNIITGYLAPTKGVVKIDGIDMMKEPQEAKKKIGYLPEIPPVYGEMTVDEYLKFAAQLKKIPAAKRAESIESAIKTAQLENVRKRLIGNLSKGYKQRVGLAQAILGDPEIIILDEPTVGLDPKQMIEIRELILSLKEKHTVILSSHILSEVSAVCDQILIISNGELVASDTPAGLQEKMQGACGLELVVKGSEDALKTVLNEISGISEYQLTNAADGEAKALLKECSGEDIREELFYALTENRLPILSLQKTKESLEDIFLQLTEKGEEENIAAQNEDEESDESAAENADNDLSTDSKMAGEDDNHVGNL